MAKGNYYEDVTHVVNISTNVGKGCEHCDELIGMDSFTESINHYIKKHGYKLLHVGTETSADSVGKPWHSVVAVLGK